jgi:endonuclease/exonuclease/phosphatase family metal-dependent hydrolase
MLLARIEPSERAIIAGDFNAGESNPAIEALRQAGFRDSYRVLHPEVVKVGTYHGFLAEPQEDKIDYLWVSPHWKVVDADIVRDKIEGRFPSDHFAVTAVLEI